MPSIQKRKTKTGEVSYRVQIRIKGKPTETATFKRLTDAREWAQQTEADIKRGKYFRTSESRKHTMTEVIDRYLKEVAALKKNTENANTYLTWWKHEIGAYFISDITPSLIIEKRNILVSNKNKRGQLVSKSTANRYTQALSHVFTVASKEWEWANENPLLNISKFKEPRGRVRFLSDEERQALLETTKESKNPFLYQVVVLALSTGARKMELLSLRWDDISFERGAIILNETKNDERRTIPLVNHAHALLKDLKTKRILGCDYIFPSKKVKRDKTGKYIYQPIDIRTAWENAKKKAKIEDFRFHDLRHSAASYLAMNGATLAEISEVLGHKTLQMVKRYAHLSEAHTSTVVANMNERIFGDGRI